MPKNGRGSKKGHDPIEVARAVIACLKRCTHVEQHRLEEPRDERGDHKVIRIQRRPKGLKLLVKGAGKSQSIVVTSERPAAAQEYLRRHLSEDYQVEVA